MFPFQNTYVQLPKSFYAKVDAAPFSGPSLLEFNSQLATELGVNLSGRNPEDLAKVFSGQQVLEVSEPIAMAYAGHQFGHFVPQLGDGRALLLGEVVDLEGVRKDIQLKGSGPTPFSRNGDGKSSLGPVVREYILSEAMHHLGVPTTRALAAVRTGEKVYREQGLPGGVFTRVASSHIRIGTFEYFAARQANEELKLLADYAIDRHYPEIETEGGQRYLDFLECVAKAHAHMVAMWMSYGFIHGVMNTDNMSISGETIDYGPCAFMDHFSQSRVFSSIDHGGRYAYQNQIPIARWNLSRLASCLIPLVDSDEDRAISRLEERLKACYPHYDQEYDLKMSMKLGFFAPTEEAAEVLDMWLGFMEAEEIDFTIGFRRLCEAPETYDDHLRFKEFYDTWQGRLYAQSQSLDEAKALMASVNPVYIARNHQVEAAIQASLRGDDQPFKELNEVLAKPFDRQSAFAIYEKAPESSERVQATFCGT